MKKPDPRVWGGMAAMMLMSLLLTGPSFPGTKKLRVRIPRASIYLEPSESSSVIAVLNQGDMVSLASPRLFRKRWHYVYFTSPESSVLKSGYILAENITRLYSVTRVITIEDNGGGAIPEPGKTTAFHWGMLRSEFRRHAGHPVDQRTRDGLTILLYTGRVMERNCNVGYVFEDDRLAGTRYRFDTQGGVLGEYRRLKSILCNRFGRPDKDLSLWSDGRRLEDESQWETAVHRGDLACVSSWETDDAHIRLSLNRVETGVALSVEMNGRGWGGGDHPVR